MNLSRAHLRRVRPGGILAAHSQASGYALVLVIALLAVTAALASVVVPDLVRQTMRLRGENETARLNRIGRGLLLSMQRAQSIPGASNWVTAVARESGLSPREVAQVYPSSPFDTNTSRIYLIHPSLKPGNGSGLLPYHQAPAGVAAGSTNAPTPDTRVMIVSNTRRELSLPLGSGVPSAADFDKLWDWDDHPSTRTPPSGWPSAWDGKGDGLHVERLDLADCFQVLTLKGLYFSVNGSYPWEAVSGQVERHFLKGSQLDIYRRNGRLYASHIVRKNAAFILPNGPLLYYRLNETSGTVATNLGILGTAANGIYMNGPVPGQAGPRPPVYTGFAGNNHAVAFDGQNDFVETACYLPSTLAGFTMAVWIMPTANLGANTGILGERDALFIKSQVAGTIRLDVGNGSGSFLDVPWPYPKDEWHHIAATGDGTGIRIYLDGMEAGSKAGATANYGTTGSAVPFRMAGKVNLDNKHSDMLLDEAVFYDMPLNDSEILDLYNGTVPFYEEP